MFSCPNHSRIFTVSLRCLPLLLFAIVLASCYPYYPGVVGQPAAATEPSNLNGVPDTHDPTNYDGPKAQAGEFVEFSKLTNSSISPRYVGVPVKTRAVFVKTGHEVWDTFGTTPQGCIGFSLLSPNQSIDDEQREFGYIRESAADLFFHLSAGTQVEMEGEIEVGKLAQEYKHLEKSLGTIYIFRVEKATVVAETNPAAPPTPAAPPRPAEVIAALPDEVRTSVMANNQWKALLIGISDYSASAGYLSSLDGVPIADIQRLADLLRNDYGFSEVTLLTDGQATRSQILAAFTNLKKSTTTDDNLLVYYAGHGYLPDSGVGVWLPADAKTPEDGITTSEVNDRLSLLAARRVLLVSDSCFSGSFLSRAVGEARFEKVVDIAESVAQSSSLARNFRPSREVITSGNLSTVPNRGVGACSQISPFACSLLGTLQSAPSGAAIGSTDLYVNTAVNYQKLATDQGQLPQKGTLTGHSGGEFFFIKR